MYIKEIKKNNTPNGKVFLQYQLTETYRIGKDVKQRIILYIGYDKLLENKNNRRIVAKLLENRITKQDTISDDLSNSPLELKKLAEQFYAKYILKNQTKNQEPEVKQDDIVYDEVNLKTLQVSNCREIGAEWVCHQMLERLGLKEFLQHKGWSETKISEALISIISRAVFSSSEHKTESWLKTNSGLLELFGKKMMNITRHNLYASSLKLYGLKSDLEEYFYNKTQTMFSLDDSILIYDLTNTYFEGRKRYSKIAEYGRSKEKRYDCKQVVLAAVINRFGFLKHSNIYKGNMSDPGTLEDIIKQMQGSGAGCGKNNMIVIDAGIATESNLDMLRSSGYSYVCVSRSKPSKTYTVDTASALKTTDKRNSEIELKYMKSDGSKDRWVYVKSAGKTKKEDSMLLKLMERFELELDGVKISLGKKGGTKKADKVWERLGRIKERNKSIHKYYDIRLDVSDGTATNLEYSRKELKQNEKQSGEYYLRTNHEFKSETEVWEIYNTVREVESTFRCLKTDLNLRPIFHKNDSSSEAHLHLGLLSYQIVSSIRYMLKEAGINYDWTNIVRILNSQKICSTSLRSKENTEIILRSCSNPSEECMVLYRALGMSYLPFKSKKFVVSH